MSSNSNSSSYINDEDQNRSILESLFDRANNPEKNCNGEIPKPFSLRDLPKSFYHQPVSKTKSQHITRRHRKDQLSLPSTPLQSSYVHSRNMSDTTVQCTTNSILSQMNPLSSTLALPDGWDERQTIDGQIYYIDHLTHRTTWDDPRPSHYIAFEAYCAKLPLPAGYKQMCDSRGNIYFIDRINKQTYRDDPRPNHYHAMMTKRLDIPSSLNVPQPQGDLLQNKLTEILKEQQNLQLRKEELERMETNVRKMLNQCDNTKNQSLTDQITIESLIDDLLLHRRQDSADSGLGEGHGSINRTFDTFSIVDDFLF